MKINDRECIPVETSSQFLCQRRRKKITQDQEKTKCDSEYTTVHFQPPSEDSNEKKKWAQLAATQYSFLCHYARKRVKERMRDSTENSESVAFDEEPRTSGKRTHSMLPCFTRTMC